MIKTDNQSLKNLEYYVNHKKKQFPNNKEKIIVYVRVSTIESAKKDLSIPNQVKVIREKMKNDEYLSKFVIEDNLTNDVIYIVDPGVSGQKYEDRPGINDILESIKENYVTHLLVYKVDRLGRSISQNSNINAELKENGVYLISASESAIDTRKGDCEFYFTLLSMFAQMELDNISERTQSAMNLRMEQGYAPPGNPPFGFEREGPIFIPEPYKSEIVKEIYDLAISGISNNDISEIINSKFNLDENEYLSPAQILRMIRNPIYKGLIVYNNCKRNQREDKAKEIRVKAKFDGLVSEEFWESANKTRKTHTKNKDIYLRKSLFPDKIKCPQCGDILQIKNSPSNYKEVIRYYRYYECKTNKKDKTKCKFAKVPADLLEALIICEFLDDIEVNNSLESIKKIQRIIFEKFEEYYNLLQNIDVKANRAKLQKRIRREQEKLKTFRDEFTNDEILKEDYEERKKIINDNIEDYKNQIANLDTIKEDKKIKYLINSIYEEELNELYNKMTVGYKIHITSDKQYAHFSNALAQYIKSINLSYVSDLTKSKLQDKFNIKFEYSINMPKFDKIGSGSILSREDRFHSYKDYLLEKLINLERIDLKNKKN